MPRGKSTVARLHPTAAGAAVRRARGTVGAGEPTAVRRGRGRADSKRRAGAVTAPVLNVQRMSTEDGPGLRTTVFLKGCSLTCTWCHNPESLSPNPEVVWHEWKCIGSRMCDATCERGALSRSGDRVVIDRELCNGCGDCAAPCPSTALELLGVERSAADVAGEVLRDRSYYTPAGGGVTISGGEPGLRPRFVRTVLEVCRAEGVHTAVDTCGMCSQAALDQICAAADLVLFDVKEIDEDKHRRFTGRSNKRILSNLVRISGKIGSAGGPSRLWVRTPLVPGATATEENVAGIGRFLASRLSGTVERWELCAFNNLARDKYRRLGRCWEFEDAELLTTGELERLSDVARRSGVDPAIVVATGATREPVAETAS